MPSTLQLLKILQPKLTEKLLAVLQTSVDKIIVSPLHLGGFYHRENGHFIRFFLQGTVAGSTVGFVSCV